MLKYLFIFISGLFICQNVKAQKTDTLVYFTDYSGKSVANAQAINIIVIYPGIDTADQKLYPVKEFYIDGHLKLTTLSKTNDYLNLIFMGSCMTFYENGHEQSICNYVNGRAKGIIVNYYPNGKFYKGERLTNASIHLLINCSDSTGKVLATNGEGEWVKYSDMNNSKPVEHGIVKDSLEEGEWQITLPDKNYAVIYHKGEIISSTDPENLGKEPVYAVVDTPAKFSEKMGTYANFIGKNLKTPASAIENNIQGKVLTMFVVEKDGTTSSFKTVKSVSKDLDAECIRVLKMMPFDPAIKNGKPVRSYFTIPINFSISYQ